KCSSTPPRVTIICGVGTVRSTNSSVCWVRRTQLHLNRRQGSQYHDAGTTEGVPLGAAARAGSRRSASAAGDPEMVELILTTFDWVPEKPRGYVRDIRVRWALEEAGLPYRVRSTSFRTRSAEHFSHQPFGQVPWLTDGDISIFESGAILLHLGNRSD